MGASEIPTVSQDEIIFNGETIHDACEPFIFYRVPRKNFAFCKNLYMPYDPVVCAALTIIAHHGGDAIKVFSDGPPEAWQPAVDWVEEVLGHRMENPVRPWLE